METFACRLSTDKLRERKATIISSLQKKLLDKKELEHGFGYKFDGSDEMLDQLIAFIKTERMCCGFFAFTLQISGNTNETWLEITGPEGVKEFLNTELGL